MIKKYVFSLEIAGIYKYTKKWIILRQKGIIMVNRDNSYNFHHPDVYCEHVKDFHTTDPVPDILDGGGI